MCIRDSDTPMDMIKGDRNDPPGRTPQQEMGIQSLSKTYQDIGRSRDGPATSTGGNNSGMSSIGSGGSTAANRARTSSRVSGGRTRAYGL